MSHCFIRSLASLAAVLVSLPGFAAQSSDAAIELRAKGVQIYTCAAAADDPDGMAWKLKGPEAKLSDSFGHVVARHFAGPTWQAADGSSVVGTPLVASASPDAAAVTWLVLRATTHEGEGLFAQVTYITRTRTVGGVAPATGCDAAHQGNEVRIPYRATYSFFTAAGP